MITGLPAYYTQTIVPLLEDERPHALGMRITAAGVVTIAVDTGLQVAMLQKAEGITG